MAVVLQRNSIAQFEIFLASETQAYLRYELINGEIVIVPSHPYVSKIAGLILTYIGMYLLQHKIGHVTGEGGGYRVAGDVCAPDVGYLSHEKQPELA